MKSSISTRSPRSVRYRTFGLQTVHGREDSIYDRFLRIPGADQDALGRAHVDLVGCGGLGGEVGHGLIRKGIGHLTLCDFDVVELSNLARQFFHFDDLGQPKALALARTLRDQATGISVIEAHDRAMQDPPEDEDWMFGDIAVVGVDNNDTRLHAAEHYLRRGVPVLFLAVDVTASRGYVFVQTSRPEDPCFACLFPDAGKDRRIYGCAGASIEILKSVAGITLYAIDSLLMDRRRPWNYKTVCLDQLHDGARRIGKRPECELCSDPERW